MTYEDSDRIIVMGPTDHGLNGQIPPERLSKLRAKPRPVRRRQVTLGATTYTAYSAHDLLDMDSIARYGRPGTF